MARRARTVGAEYRLVFTPTTDPHTNSPSVRVSLETAQVFSQYRYGLSVEESREGTRIRYTVRGLAAPDLSLPGAGRAGFVREYRDLWGTCHFEVTGLDGAVSACTVRLTPGSATIVTGPETARLIVHTPGSRSQERP